MATISLTSFTPSTVTPLVSKMMSPGSLFGEDAAIVAQQMKYAYNSKLVVKILLQIVSNLV